jgi:hypothetical protein
LAGDDIIRNKLFDIGNKNKDLFKGRVNTLTPQYTQIFSKELLSKNYINRFYSNIEVIQKRIKIEIQNFISNEMKEINNYIIQNFV